MPFSDTLSATHKLQIPIECFGISFSLISLLKYDIGGTFEYECKERECCKAVDSSKNHTNIPGKNKKHSFDINIAILANITKIPVPSSLPA